MPLFVFIFPGLCGPVGSIHMATFTLHIHIHIHGIDSLIKAAAAGAAL